MDYLTHRCTNIILLFYTTYTSIDLAHHEIFRAKKVGKGCIKIAYFIFPYTRYINPNTHSKIPIWSPYI